MAGIVNNIFSAIFLFLLITFFFNTSRMFNWKIFPKIKNWKSRFLNVSQVRCNHKTKEKPCKTSIRKVSSVDGSTVDFFSQVYR